MIGCCIPRIGCCIPNDIPRDIIWHLHKMCDFFLQSVISYTLIIYIYIYYTSEDWSLISPLKTDGSTLKPPFLLAKSPYSKPNLRLQPAPKRRQPGPSAPCHLTFGPNPAPAAPAFAELGIGQPWERWNSEAMGVSQNGWFMIKNPIEMDDLGLPPF